MNQNPTIGEKIPDFIAPMTSNKTFTLHDYQGKTIVLMFYPKDNTPGCTDENKDFAANYKKFQALGVEVFGLSRDSIRKHENFKVKLELPYELISDADEVICNFFNLLKQKSMFGKKYIGIERSTFIISPKGTLQQEWRKVKIEGHVTEVLNALSL
tara:strand:- start:312 stop:779 length:468 start_codon:yes stop_codon:yes gene_type:complete